MAGCGKLYNGGHKVEGKSLHCGTNLFWKMANGGDNKARQQEVVLCDDCKASEKS